MIKMKCNACGKIINNDAFICKECDEVNCLECRVENPKGLKLPICTLCGTDLLSPIWEEENKKEKESRLQIESPGNLLGDWPKPKLDIPELLSTFKAPKSHNCPECSFPILSSHYYSEHLDQELGEAHQFCSERCAKTFMSKHLCYTCDGKIGLHYQYCMLCGDMQRYCSTSCYQYHNDSKSLFGCLLRAIAK